MKTNQSIKQSCFILLLTKGFVLDVPFIMLLSITAQRCPNTGKVSLP